MFILQRFKGMVYLFVSKVLTKHRDKRAFKSLLQYDILRGTLLWISTVSANYSMCVCICIYMYTLYVQI